MNHLYDNINENYKNFILFPLSIRIDGGIIRDGQIIFDKLHEQYWQIGLPIEPNLKEKFIKLLANIMNEIHLIGVVHLDLYPSNIMWRINPIDQNDILIKIIDWDSAHFTDEILEKHVIERLYNGRQTLKDNIGPNNINYDVSLFNIIEKYKDTTDLQSNAKNVLDTAFKNYVLQKAGAINEKYNK
jgi:serine/threonine protein kinase